MKHLLVLLFASYASAYYTVSLPGNAAYYYDGSGNMQVCLPVSIPDFSSLILSDTSGNNVGGFSQQLRWAGNCASASFVPNTVPLTGQYQVRIVDTGNSPLAVSQTFRFVAFPFQPSASVTSVPSYTAGVQSIMSAKIISSLFSNPPTIPQVPYSDGDSFSFVGYIGQTASGDVQTFAYPKWNTYYVLQFPVKFTTQTAFKIYFKPALLPGVQIMLSNALIRSSSSVTTSWVPSNQYFIM